MEPSRETLSLHFDLHPKRTRIVIILVTLACCAFFLAQGTSNLVAAKFLPTTLPSAAVATAKPGEREALKGERPPDFHTILERNIFDPTTGSLWPPKPVIDPTTVVAPGDAAPPPLAEGEMPPVCDGQARLVATIYSEGLPEWSFASVAIGSATTLLYRPGNQIENRQLDSIFPEAVYLKAGNGALCSLMMFHPEGLTKTASAAPAVAEPAAEGSVAPATPSFYGSSLTEAELDSSIKQVSDNKYSVTRTLIDKVLANQSELMRSARVVPHEENGRVIGVKLYGIRRSSLLGKLGLQNGDLMRTINGFDMSSPDSALEAYTKLRSAGNLSVNVVRRGSPVTMDYQVGQ